MARLIAPGVCRYSLNGLYGSRPVANIWDMHIDSQNFSERDLNVPTVAEKLLTAWVENILPEVCNDYSFVSVSWVDLDSDEGTTGEITTAGAINLPDPGGEAAAPMPGNVAAKVDKTINRTRGRRNGRLYLCGIPEAFTEIGAPNVLTAGAIAAVNAAFAAFLTDVDEDVLNYQSDSVVVHTETPRDVNGNIIPDADPEFVGFSPINTLVCDSTVATQRRRLR